MVKTGKSVLANNIFERNTHRTPENKEHMNTTQTTHSAKNVHGKNPWPSGDLNPGLLACGASALPTELPGRRDKPGSTKYLQWVSRSRYTVQTHKQDKTHQSTGSITDTYSPSLILGIQLS